MTTILQTKLDCYADNDGAGMIRFVDWSYLAEGGHHVILRYRGQEKRYKGFILRIEKIIPSVTNLVNDSKTENKYVSTVIEPFLSHLYISYPKAVAVDTVFVTQLNDHLRMDTSRCRVELVDEGCSIAHIFCDVTDISSATPLSISTEAVCQRYAKSEDIQLSIEIKVKNGFKSISPFVSMRIKHATSRYRFNQYIKHFKFQKNNIGMKYGGEFPGISKYDPADVCSRDFARVSKSFNNLLQNPQNNLKISCNGKHIYGLDLCEEKELQEGCSKLFSSCAHPPEHARDIGNMTQSPAVATLANVISEILCVESALQRLSYIQGLDVLDVEGVERVFDVFSRRVTSGLGVCGTEQEHNARTLDIIARHLEADLTLRLPLLHNEGVSSRYNGKGNEVKDMDHFLESLTTSLRHDPSACVLNSLQCQLNSKYESAASECVATVSSNCQCVLHRLRRFQVDESTPSEELAAMRAQCVEEIEALDTAECLFLLRLWLVCLAASDASVVVTLKEVAASHSSSSGEGRNVRSNASSSIITRTREDIRICNSQTDTALGSVCVKSPETGNDTYFCYKVTFLDLGPKPVGKIVDKTAREEQLCLEAEAGLCCSMSKENCSC